MAFTIIEKVSAAEWSLPPLDVPQSSVRYTLTVTVPLEFGCGVYQISGYCIYIRLYQKMNKTKNSQNPTICLHFIMQPFKF